MKKTLLAFIFFLLSTQSFSKVGDVYYCEMTQAIELKEGKLINYIPQKFKFTIESENIIRFGLDANYFRGSSFEIIESEASSVEENTELENAVNDAMDTQGIEE